MNYDSHPLPPNTPREVVDSNEAAFAMSRCSPFTDKFAPSKWGQLVMASVIAMLFMLMSITSSHALAEEIIAADAALNGGATESSTADTPAPPISSTANDAIIETKPAPQKDNDIQERISGIFSEIDGLQAVTVKVNKGVVILGGEVPNEKKAQQAISLTNRLSDVVTVEDSISRTLDVQDNVTTVYQGLKLQFKHFLKAAPLLLVAMVVFGVVAWLGTWLSKRDSLWRRLAPNPFVGELLAQTIKVIFVILGLILALSLVGAEAIIGTLLGGAGVIGIAVGFAVKDTIENYIASLMLSVRQPFRARDQVDINGHEGIVVRLTSRATILMTFDGNQLRIPNSEVFKGTILNYTKNPERRFTFELGVDANDDPLAAIKVGLDAIKTLDFVLEKPKTMAIITEVGDSNIILQFQVWVDQSQTDFFKARSIAIRETKHALENNGFSLPEPIYRLRFNADVEDSFKHLSKGGAGMTVTPTTPEQDRNSLEVIHNKKLAKERAKQILQGANAEELLTAQSDNKLMEKVEQEIAENKDETDLLDQNSPQE